MFRRVVAVYLLISLTALGCLAMSVAVGARSVVIARTEGVSLARIRAVVGELAWTDLLAAPAAALGATISGVVLVGGACLLWKSLRLAEQVERQLVQVAEIQSSSEPHIDLVIGRGMAARGWNRLSQLLAEAAAQDGLHDRLATALERYRRSGEVELLDAYPDGVAVTDPQGRFAFANPTAAALLGDSGSNLPLAERAIYDVLIDEAPHSELAPLLEADSQQRNVVVELTRDHTGGESVLRVARRPLRTSGGQPTGAHIWSLRDVTQQKLAEKMHNEFVNSATHELRTPMANIKAYAETLAGADELDLEEQKEFCNTINAEVSRLSRLIDDLLSIESMEVGSLALARQETDVERLLREKVEMVRPLMEKKKLHFDVRLPEKLPKMLIDKDKVALAIDNLLGNAAKYTPVGGEVAFHVEVDEKSLRVEVRDTGVGIAADELPMVFDKFFRSQDPRVRDESGTGLGLAMVREIVHLHGGELNAESKLDEGSTFAFTLPMG
jgi:two-component system phosphate regulon sensor histidine kinase PhoR